MRTLILASTSPYRRQLLRQLGLPFKVAAPLSVERIDPSISPELLVKHLALEKAQSLRNRYADALIIGSDQVFVDPRGRMLGKPGTAEAAVRQLKAMAGHRHTFYTGLALVDTAGGETAVDHATFSVTLRALDEEQIRAYVQRENPVDCAGSFKVEGLGIALMERLEGNDYTSLIGLPLILLCDMLRRFGVDPLAPSG